MRDKLEATTIKIWLLYKKVAYLGYIINEEEVKSWPKEIAAVQNFPKIAKNVREFLDLAGYYRHFINKFSQILKPLVRSSVRMQNLIEVSGYSEVDKEIQIVYDLHISRTHIAYIRCDMTRYSIGVNKGHRAQKITEDLKSVLEGSF